MSAEAHSMVEKEKLRKNRLRVSRVVDAPLEEVSGICLRRGRETASHR